MDDEIKKNMKSFIYSDNKKDYYKIGVLCSMQNNIMLIGLSRIDDKLGSFFHIIATSVYYNYFSYLDPESIHWIQCYPGYRGFNDTFENVYLDWIDNKYHMFYREPITLEDLKSFKQNIISFC